MPPSPGMIRVNFELDEDVNRRMQKALLWGTKGPCIRVLVTKLVEAVERDGQIIVGAILDGNFDLVYTPPDKEGKK